MLGFDPLGWHVNERIKIYVVCYSGDGSFEAAFDHRHDAEEMAQTSEPLYVKEEGVYESYAAYKARFLLDELE